MSLFGSDHRTRDDGGVGFQGQLDESASAKALKMVTLFVSLADALFAFGKHGYQMAFFKQPLRIIGGGAYTSDTVHEGAHEGEVIDEVFHQETDIPPRRMVVLDGQTDHRPVEGKGARMVGNDERPTLIG